MADATPNWRFLYLDIVEGVPSWIRIPRIRIRVTSAKTPGEPKGRLAAIFLRKYLASLHVLTRQTTRSAKSIAFCLPLVYLLFALHLMPVVTRSVLQLQCRWLCQ
jgi:hypothetical protein